MLNQQLKQLPFLRRFYDLKLLLLTLRFSFGQILQYFVSVMSEVNVETDDCLVIFSKFYENMLKSPKIYVNTILASMRHLFHRMSHGHRTRIEHTQDVKKTSKTFCKRVLYAQYMSCFPAISVLKIFGKFSESTILVSPETLRKLCLSTKFSHQKIR